MKKQENQVTSPTMSTKDGDKLKGSRKKPQLEIYRPGVGPLRKGNRAETTDPKPKPNCSDDNVDKQNERAKPVQKEPPASERVGVNNSSPDVDPATIEKLETLRLDGNTTPVPQGEKKNRTKRPDMQLYVPKHRSNMMKDEEERKRNSPVFNGGENTDRKHSPETGPCQQQNNPSRGEAVYHNHHQQQQQQPPPQSSRLNVPIENHTNRNSPSQQSKDAANAPAKPFSSAPSECLPAVSQVPALVSARVKVPSPKQQTTNGGVARGRGGLRGKKDPTTSTPNSDLESHHGKCSGSERQDDKSRGSGGRRKRKSGRLSQKDQMGWRQRPQESLSSSRKSPSTFPGFRRPSSSISSSNEDYSPTKEKARVPFDVEVEDWDLEVATTTSHGIPRAISQDDIPGLKDGWRGGSSSRLASSSEDWEKECFSEEYIQQSSSQSLNARVGHHSASTVQARQPETYKEMFDIMEEEQTTAQHGKALDAASSRKAPEQSEKSATALVKSDSAESLAKSCDTVKKSSSSQSSSHATTKAKAERSMDWSEEVEKSLELQERQKNTKKVQKAYDSFETSDIDTPESPMPVTKKKHKASKRKRRSKSESNERYRQRGSNSRASSTVAGSAKPSGNLPGTRSVHGGGIIRLPSAKQTSPSPGASNDGYSSQNNPFLPREAAHAPGMQQRHLFNPKNPNNPHVVYKPGYLSSSHERGQHVSEFPEISEEHAAGSVTSNHNGYANSPSSPVMCPPMYPPMPGFMYPPYSASHPDALYYPVPHPVSSVEIQGPSYSKLSAAQRNIREAVSLENELNCHLGRSFDIIDHKKLGQCRWKIQLRYENAILSEVEYCTKNNVEQALWKAAYYQVIETFRKHMIDHPSMKDDIRKALIGLIEEGVIFYENLLEKLQETFGFTLSAFLDSDAIRSHSLPRPVKMALVSAQKMIICLGDLARYREQANETSNYGKARSWYLKAQQLAPKNGRPYNQLAILALYARRKLDAVYFYMRSLAASNPFHTARESLLSLFDEARKKYEQVERKRHEERATKKEQLQGKEGGRSRFVEGRQEVWVLPRVTDGPQQHDQQAGNANNGAGGPRDPSHETTDDELGRLSTVDLNKKFILSFLHTHGKLFTKIGMETFVETSTQMLHEFECLLRHVPIPVSGSRLLQLMAINMFTLHHTELKDTSLEPNCRSLLQEHALQVSLEMFGVLLRRCLTLLEERGRGEGGDGPDDLLLSEDLQHLVPPVKVWCDWLMCHPAVWNPPPSLNDYRTSSSGGEDAWSLLARMVSFVKTMDTVSVQIRKEPANGWEPVVLPEDTQLAGFVPLLTLPPEANYASVAASYDKELVRNVLRLRRLQFCADYLCGIVPPVLCYDVQRQAYVSLVTDDSEEEDSDDSGRPPPSPELSGPGGDSSSESSFAEDHEGEAAFGRNNRGRHGSEIQQLRTRKEELRKKKAQQEQQKRQIQAVLHETRSSRTVLEISPHFLIPDTNCFIDHLEDIRRLVDTRIFQLTVPLVVVNELDGLAKGCRSGESMSMSSSSSTASCALAAPPQPSAAAALHLQHVTRGAKDALEFLSALFAGRNSHVRAATAHGSELDTIAFRSEEMCDNVGTNDDLILYCCLRYCDDKHGGRTCQDKDGQTKIYRRLVLLTDDRNLRLKAMSQDVPVRDIVSFMSMLHVS